MKPFGIISDTHNHAWSSFSTVNVDGINSRLQEILDETIRCAKAIREVGGDTLIHCGDLFHVRGSVAPAVLNPTLDTYRYIMNTLGVTVFILAGNHDLEGKESARVSNAITALEGIGCNAIHTSTRLGNKLFIPWHSSLKDLKEELERQAKIDTDCDVFLHAPIDGVIPGLPDHGLTAEYLHTLGFNRVFSGHYHHHKVFPGTLVYSVGALTHQTWGDVNSKAGFLIVDDKSVTWNSTHAPKFAEITGAISEADAIDLCDGNYVRVRMTTSKPAEIEAMRAHLEGFGAKGVIVLPEPPKTTATRTATAIKAGASIDVSVGDWINASSIANKAEVSLLALETLAEAQASL